MTAAAEDAKHRSWWRIAELQPIRREHVGNKLPLRNGWRQEPAWRVIRYLDQCNLFKAFFWLRLYVCNCLDDSGLCVLGYGY